MNKVYMILLLCSVIAFSCTNAEIKQHDKTIIATHDFLREFPAFSSDSLVNVVVEIPAGSNEKWEVDKATGYLAWEPVSDDSLRVVKYLPYPTNYGMIPRTWLPVEKGGDDDQLDVFLLGQSVERGSVVPAKIIGVITMLDKGLQDDKLIAVPEKGLFSEISTLDQLNSVYPGVTDILKIWLSSYKGGRFIEIQGVKNYLYAYEILENASDAYELRGSWY